MNSGYRVIDADRHVMEPFDLWERYLEPAFRSRVSTVDGRCLVDGRPVQSSASVPLRGGNIPFTANERYQAVFGDALAHSFDGASNVRDMDREGVDVGVHFPGTGLFIIWTDAMDADIAAGICRAYNNWLADYCRYDPVRLKGIALVPLQDPLLAIHEIRRAKELGLVGVMWRPNPLRGRTFASPDYLPVYRAAVELDMPVLVHEGSSTLLPQAGVERLSAFGKHIACHALEQMLACLILCGDGVLEQFPDLRVGFMESGCGWVPYWLERMDDHWYNYFLGRPRTTKEPPSVYFKRQCFISCEAGEELIDTVVTHVGDHCLVTATDYPHPDAVDKFPEHTVGDLVTNAHLTESSKRRILWENPARLYGIPR